MKKGEYANHEKYGTVYIKSVVISTCGKRAYIVVTYDNRQLIVGASELTKFKGLSVKY